MTKILFLVPKCIGPSQNSKWNTDFSKELEMRVTKTLWKVVTLGPLVLASQAIEAGEEVDYVDEEYGEVQLNTKYDIVAMYLVTPNARKGYQWAEYFRKIGSYIVMGGVHATVCFSETKTYADTVLLGEGEDIWKNFFSDYKNNNPKKIYRQQIGCLDVNTSPIPAYHLIAQNARAIIPVQTARGCPHGCRFCNVRNIYGLNYRYKDEQKVIQEIECALSCNPKAKIYFTDDNFFCDCERTKKLLNYLEKFQIQWIANADISFGSDIEMIKSAYKSGCRQVLIGFESVNANNLAHIDVHNFKYNHCNDYPQVISNIQCYGIGVIGSFIIGLDNDDSSVFIKTEEFIYKNKLFGANITVNTPYPGTSSFYNLKRQNRIRTYDWNQYTIFQPVITPKRMTYEELCRGYVKLIKSIHSDKRNIEVIMHFKEIIKSLRGTNP